VLYIFLNILYLYITKQSILLNRSAVEPRNAISLRVASFWLTGWQMVGPTLELCNGHEPRATCNVCGNWCQLS